MLKHPATKTLLFVYNSDSGIANALLDYGQKIINPNSYECKLCSVTYGPFGKKREWKRFVASLPFDAMFLHRDELRAQHPTLASTPLPVVLLLDGDDTKAVVSADDFAGVDSLSDLKKILTDAVAGE